MADIHNKVTEAEVTLDKVMGKHYYNKGAKTFLCTFGYKHETWHVVRFHHKGQFTIGSHLRFDLL